MNTSAPAEGRPGRFVSNSLANCDTPTNEGHLSWGNHEHG